MMKTVTRFSRFSWVVCSLHFTHTLFTNSLFFNARERKSKRARGTPRWRWGGEPDGRSLPYLVKYPVLRRHPILSSAFRASPIFPSSFPFLAPATQRRLNSLAILFGAPSTIKQNFRRENGELWAVYFTPGLQSVVCTLTAFIPYIFSGYISPRLSSAGAQPQEVKSALGQLVHSTGAWPVDFCINLKATKVISAPPERDASLSSLVATIAYFFKCARSPCETCTILLPCNVFVQKLNS